MKQLGHFYKILLNLWLQDDYVQVFESNISQLNGLFTELLAIQDHAAMRNDPQIRLKVQRLFTILRGLFRGATSHKNFALLFDWFYPEYFGIVKKCMTVYLEPPCDDEIVLQILKFLHDLVDNSSNRLRFDTWSINGLIVYKETSSFVIEFMELSGCLSLQKKPLKQGDIYKEIFRFLKVIMTLLERCISGNFINFAICEYYNDQTFTQLSQMTFQCVLH
jgi:hypothetical protein